MFYLTVIIIEYDNYKIVRVTIMFKNMSHIRHNIMIYDNSSQ